MVRYTIDGRTYEVYYEVIEPYRPATFSDPTEGYIEPARNVHLVGDGDIPYEQFIDLLREYEGEKDLRYVERRVLDDLWEDYMRDLEEDFYDP